MYELDESIKKGVAENVAGDVNSKKRYHFLYPHVPLDMHTDHEYNKLSDRDLQAVKSHQRELADKLGEPGAEKQSDIASHIQINRARSEYDQEQAHRRKVLDAEKIKRQARDAKRKQQGVAEAFPNPGSGSTGSSKEDKRIAAALRKKHIPSTPNDKKKGVAEMRDRRDSYQRDYDSSQTGFGRGHDHRGLGQELAHETNNIAIAINGKTWKVVPCKGTADSPEEYNYLRHMKNWAEKKSASSGKKWTVHLTGASVTESATAGATSAANVAVGPVYKNKPAKAAKNKDGTVKNALDMKANLLTGGSIKR